MGYNGARKWEDNGGDWTPIFLSLSRSPYPPSSFMPVAMQDGRDWTEIRVITPHLFPLIMRRFRTKSATRSIASMQKQQQQHLFAFPISNGIAHRKERTRLLFPLLHAESKGNRRRLHTGYKIKNGIRTTPMVAQR